MELISILSRLSPEMVQEVDGLEREYFIFFFPFLSFPQVFVVPIAQTWSSCVMPDKPGCFGMWIIFLSTYGSFRNYPEVPGNDHLVSPYLCLVIFSLRDGAFINSKLLFLCIGWIITAQTLRLFQEKSPEQKDFIYD
ncbi:MAG: hypothetical protein LUG96_13170 [Tannerellaceae bacterium]|nr:hypothetical protein [Tannerellaceae bacterium]